MKRDTTEKLKFRRLAKALGIPAYQTAGLLEMLWHTTAKNTPDGGLGRFSNQDIADAIGWEKPADELVETLVREHWLDTNDQFRLVVHDWSEHAEDSIHVMLARRTQYFADGAMPKLSRLAGPERDRVARAYEALKSAQECPALASSSLAIASASSQPDDGQPQQTPAASKRQPMREGNPLYARLRERIGRDLYTHEDRNLADLAVRLDANPVIVADKPVDTETMILAAIECLPPGVEKPLAYMATVIDTARQSCTMPGSSASKAGKASKPLTASELCAAINEGRITRCDGKPLPEGVWKYNTQRMSCDGKPFMPVNEIGGHAWS